MPATKRKTGTTAANAGKKAATRKTSAKKAAAKKATAKKTASQTTKKSAAVKTARKAATKKAATKAATQAAKKAAPQRKTAASAKPKTAAAAGAGLEVGPIRGFKPYQPRKGEEYMNERQLEHFRQILLAWKRELMEEVDRTVHHMQDEAGNFPDPNDRATQEEEFSLELRTRDRERKLIRKIDEALKRIEDGEYGYCESCGVEIGIRRLEARPTATLCIDCKTLDEVRERQMGL